LCGNEAEQILERKPNGLVSFDASPARILVCPARWSIGSFLKASIDLGRFGRRSGFALGISGRFVGHRGNAPVGVSGDVDIASWRFFSGREFCVPMVCIGTGG